VTAQQWDKTARETLKLYQEVIEENKAKRPGEHL
jgi:hypothetical protein